MRIFVAILIITTLCLAAHGDDSSRVEPPWASPAQDLERLGYSVSTPSLLEIVGGAEPSKIKSLAIRVLGLRGENESVSLLRDVMVRAPEERLRHEATVALVSLGDEAGGQELKRLCHSDHRRRFYFAAQLAEAGDASCLSTVLEAEDSDNTVVLKQAIASVPAFYGVVSEADRSRLRSFLAKMLRHESRSVRWVALGDARSSFSSWKLDLDEFYSMFADFAAKENDPELKTLATRALTTWGRIRVQEHEP